LRRADVTKLLSQALLFALSLLVSLVGNLVYFPFIFALPIHSKDVDAFRGDLVL
jgi:hypothetical protein